MAIGTSLPRPEYPRPDRQRGFVHGVDWRNLNGAWEFRFDPDKRGFKEKWFLPGGATWAEQITVPFCWQSLAAWGEADAAGNDNYFSRRAFLNPLEVDRHNYRDAARFEVGWYRRTLSIPQNEHWENKRVILTVGAADFFTDCWCNGRHLGRNELGYIPFEFDLTEALQESYGGSATIVFRVEDPIDNAEQTVGKQWGWYSSVSGIWQTVFLEPRAPAFIERFEITPDLERREVAFKVFTAGGNECDAEVTAPDGRILHLKMAIADGVGATSLLLPEVMPWDPANPQLYRVRFTLNGQPVPDVVHGYFGMRSISARPRADVAAPSAICLNSHPVFLRGVLHQSYYPDGIYTAGDVQVLKDDIAYAKRVGFDLLRIHIKVDDPLLLYWADTLGILLLCDFPNFGEGGDTPLGRERFEKTMRAAIQRDFNHPAIIGWCLFNETWGFGGQAEFVEAINLRPPHTGPAVLERPAGAKIQNLPSFTWIDAMWGVAKALDPTRLVEDMSVVAWEHVEGYGHTRTDVNSWHFYTADYQFAKQHIADVVRETYAGSGFNYIPGFAQEQQPLINSEYGGVGALAGDIDVSWSFKFLTNELRLHGQLSGYIFTELHDVEWERNGLLNYDRTPKTFGYDPMIVNHGDVLPIDTPPIRRVPAGNEIEVDVFSSHFAQQARQDVVLHWTLSGLDSLGRTYDRLAQGSKPLAFPQYQVERAARIKLQLSNETMLCTLWVRAVNASGELVASNYVQFFADAGFAPRQEMGGRLILRAEVNAWTGSAWSGVSSTADEARRQGFCYGEGYGFYEYQFPIQEEEPRTASKLIVLCEVSAHREGTPQTDSIAHPTSFRMQLNGCPIYTGLLPNHPHDAAGALSYLRPGGRGAYGYLARATIEGDLLRQVLAHTRANVLCLRCIVPADEFPIGGLTIYGGDCGHSPVPPTLIVERHNV